MAVYGPYHAGTVADNGGGAAWSNPGDAAGTADGNAATASIVGEGVTSALQLTSFGAQVPAGASIASVRFEINPTPQSKGQNISDCGLVGTGAYSTNLGDTGVYSDDNATLTPADINAAAFGCWFSVYAQAGGDVAVDSVALTVETA